MQQVPPGESWNCAVKIEKCRWLEREGKDSIGEEESFGEGRPFPHLGSYNRHDRIKKAAYLLLEAQKASVEQKQFFETWLKIVFDEACPVSSEGAAQLRVPTDIESFELSIKAPKELMLRLANRFLEACKVPDLRMLQQFAQLQWEKEDVSEVSLWCRLKRFGSSCPGVDAGFHLDHSLEWLVTDIVVPKSEDQANLRNNAMSHRLVPFAYGASLLPIEPESSLTFDMETGSMKSSILSALFMFGAMGFAKPEDLGLTAITHVDAMKCYLLAALGPKGLTRMALRFEKPQASCVSDLTSACNIPMLTNVINDLEIELDKTPGFVEYAAEMSGCVGMCVGLCKRPMQRMFGEVLGMPLSMEPNMEDLSCTMVFGKDPEPWEQDDLQQQPCFRSCATARMTGACPKLS
ncbi:D27 [Symbiodinium microadriaticum]|nr:D27 [Symbiodinium microadriaticum]